MDGQSSFRNSLELMLMHFGRNVNDVVYVPEADPNQQVVTSDGSSDHTQANDLPSLPHSFEDQRTPLNYYEFLTEHSSLIEKPHTHDNVLDPASVTDSHLVQCISEIQPELLYGYPGLASASKLAVSSLDLDSWKLNPYSYMFDTSHHEPSLNIKCNEQDLMVELKSFQDQSQAQSHIPLTQGLSEEVCIASQSRPRAKVVPSVFMSNPGYNASRRKATLNDRQRKERISERLQALQELLPHSVQGSQTRVMDAIIEHVKYLQFQMKELSRSRLRGDLHSGPSIFLEGYQHYILQKQLMNEPLEDTMEKFLKANSSAATKFLESKGLLVLPMALADRLKQAI
ncbi:uncharacterized protein LOC126686104 [Mercurialis annua]|uniref:uncharacterized protein LOC126686104 n=1 Tax=Mercurialis annua TaxID=3986 RepID=UPI00215E4091|nr:uncharacterized protein LOC126686104 [Mercurialis annua]